MINIKSIITLSIVLSSFCCDAAIKYPFKRWQDSNGADVLFYQAMDVPMLDISVAFPAGSARDGDKQGMAALTANMMNQGSLSMSANTIASTLENTGAQYGSDVNRDMAVFSLRTLTDVDAMNQALAVFTDIISKPAFPSKSFSRQQQQQIMSIRESSQSLDRVATDAFYQHLYGKHPYAHPVLGNIEDVQSLVPDDLKSFNHEYYVQANAIVVLVGAIDESTAHTIAHNLIKQLPKGHKAKAIEKALPVKQAETFNSPFPSSQVALRIGQLGINHQTPAYYALQVGNYILGGGSLVSRLAVEVREHRGLTYGVSSVFEPLPAIGPFLISLSTKKDQANEALSLTLSIVDDYIQKGPTNDELNAAKKYLTGSFPLSLASNKSIANMLLRMAFYNLPDDFLENYTLHINEVKINDIKSAFEEHIHPDKLLTIHVGG